MKIKTVSLWKCITTRRRNSIFSRVEEEEAGWPTKSLLAGFIVGGFHHIISSSLRNCEWRVLTPLWFFVQHCFLMAEWCRCFALITGGAVLLGSIPIPEGRFGWEIFILDKVELYFDPTDDIYEVENANSNTQDHHCVGLYIFLIVLMVVIIVSFHCFFPLFHEELRWLLWAKSRTHAMKWKNSLQGWNMVDPAEESSSSVLVISWATSLSVIIDHIERALVMTLDSGLPARTQDAISNLSSDHNNSTEENSNSPTLPSVSI